MKQYQNKTSLSIERLERLNHIVMRNNGQIKELGDGQVFDTTRGKIRNEDVVWGNAFSFISHTEVRNHLKPILNHLNKEIQKPKDILEAYKLSFWLHYEILRIHPFLDGNSCNSRL